MSIQATDKMADASREEKLKAARETVRIITVRVLIAVQTVAEEEGRRKDIRRKDKEAKSRRTERTRAGVRRVFRNMLMVPEL